MVTRTPVPIDLPITTIATLCQEHHVQELSFFGSVLRDDFRADSDIDMLVLFAPDARIGCLAFGASNRGPTNALGRRVDLVSKRGLHPAIRQNVLDSAQVIYGAE